MTHHAVGSLAVGYHPRGGAGWVLLAIVVVVVCVRLVLSQCRGYAGDAIHRVVRCSRGHPFLTTRIPGASLTAVRLGSVRYQRCPVGRHWALVRPVKDEDLTDDERRSLGI